MKLTKFVHSCVLVEDAEHTALFDPGKFSWESGLVKLDTWPKLDHVIITHEHFDHFHVPFVEAIVKQFPDVKFISTEPVVKQLQEKGLTNTSFTSDNLVDVEPLNHEDITPLAPETPQNIRVHYKSKVTHPGDSHHAADSKEVLLLPVTAPWGTTVDAVRLAAQLKPKVVVPIHDWMWNDEWRARMYDGMEMFFAGQGIRFIKVVDGMRFAV